MPKKGEKARKLAALSRGKGVKPPKAWFNLMTKKTTKTYPNLGLIRKGAIIGGIWARMSTASKKKIVRKDQK